MYDPNKAHYIIVTCILVKDNKFLITKRASTEKTFPDVWTVPGGKLEVSDYKEKPMDTSIHWYNTFEDLLKREVMEEVGLKVNSSKYLTSMVFIRKQKVPTLIASFYSEDFEGDIKLSEEMSEHAWVSLEEAKDYDLIVGIYEELEMLDKVLKGENPKGWSKKR